MLINQQQQKLISIYFSYDPSRYACYKKVNTFKIIRGSSGGAIPPGAEDFFKTKIKQNGGFSCIIFCFFARLPKSPKL